MSDKTQAVGSVNYHSKQIQSLKVLSSVMIRRYSGCKFNYHK